MYSAIFVCILWISIKLKWLTVLFRSKFLLNFLVWLKSPTMRNCLFLPLILSFVLQAFLSFVIGQMHTYNCYVLLNWHFYYYGNIFFSFLITHLCFKLYFSGYLYRFSRLLMLTICMDPTSKFNHMAVGWDFNFLPSGPFCRVINDMPAGFPQNESSKR